MARTRRRREVWISLAATFLAALLLALTGFWQAAIIGGLIAGFLARTVRRGLVVGLLGVGAAWATILGFYVMSQPIIPLLEIFISIMGLSAGLYWLTMLLTVALGMMIGAAAGSVAALLPQVLFSRKGESAQPPS